MVNGYTSLGVGSYLRGQPTLRVAFCQSLLCTAYGLRCSAFFALVWAPQEPLFYRCRPATKGAKMANRVLL